MSVGLPNLMWVVVYILIVSTAVIFTPSNVKDLFVVPKEMVYTLFGFMVIASSWMTKTNKRMTYKNLWGGLLLIYTVAGFCWFYYMPRILSEGRYVLNFWTVTSTINIILGLFLIQVLVENTTTIRNWLNVSKTLCWTAFGVSVFALLQYIGLDQVFGASQEFIAFTNTVFNRKQLMMAFFGHEFHTANYIAVISPLCLMFNQKRYKFIYGVIFLTICLTDNTTSFCSFILGLLCYLILTKKYRILFLTAVLCLVGGYCMGVFYQDFWKPSGRFFLWKEIAEKTIASDLVYLGSGFGSFRYSGFTTGGLKAWHAHNEYIQMFYEGGLGLLIIFFGYLISLFKRGYIYLKRNNSILFTCYICAFITYLFSCVNGFPLRIAPLALLGILYIASLEAQIQGETYI